MGAFLFWIEMHPSFLVSQKPGFSKKPGFLAAPSDRPPETTDKQSAPSYNYCVNKIADSATKVNTLQKKIFI